MSKGDEAVEAMDGDPSQLEAWFKTDGLEGQDEGWREFEFEDYNCTDLNIQCSLSHG